MDDLLVTREAASRLHISLRRVRALVEADRLPARRATPVELVALLQSGRVRTIPPSGLIVIQVCDLALVESRPHGYPKGRPRRKRSVDSE